ncbi:MAG TPA: AAA family ATPase, partial [Longimicrobium sp.]|nr:AAA family ATPase [Longimicrobium sp.]
LDEAMSADYGVEFTADPHGPPIIGREYCRILAHGEELHSFEVEAGSLTKQLPGIRPVVEPGRLMLYAASDAPEFKPVYNFLTGVRVHAVDPNELREIRATGPGLELEKHGRNAAAVLRVLQERFTDRHARLIRILGSVVPGVTNVLTEGFGNIELLRFSERTGAAGGTVRMDQFSASDGTLRMLGILLAVYQPTTPTVLIVEEPEATIHPAAADVLVSVLMDAAKRSQVIVTTHSPDVLDNKEITDDMLRVVSKPSGRTIIAPISSASRAAVRQNLYSPGELLRMDELNPEIESPHPDSAASIGSAGTAG